MVVADRGANNLGPDAECPVCPHALKYHDGMGCTEESASGDGSMCPCPVAQSMPGSSLSRGALAPKIDDGSV